MGRPNGVAIVYCIDDNVVVDGIVTDEYGEFLVLGIHLHSFFLVSNFRQFISIDMIHCGWRVSHEAETVTLSFPSLSNTHIPFR
jgi:hypothetical protein